MLPARFEPRSPRKIRFNSTRSSTTPAAVMIFTALMISILSSVHRSALTRHVSAAAPGVMTIQDRASRRRSKPKCMAARLIVASLAVLWLSGFPRPVPAASEAVVVAKPDARFVFIALDAKAVDSVHAAYVNARSGLVERIGWQVDFAPTVVLVGDRERFRSMVGRLPIAGYAVPGEMAMVLDYTGAVAAGALMPLLRHELCHLLLHRSIPNGLLPRWLDEGVAQWVSDGLSDLVYGMDRRLLQRAVLSGRHLPLRNLDTGFYRDEQTLRLAYAQSASLVRTLVDTFGDAALLRLLNQLKQGTPLERAARIALGISIAEWEAVWRESFNTFGGRLAALASHLYSILFFLTAVLTLVAYIRYRKRRKSMAEDEDEDEITFPPGPSASGPPPP